MEPLSGLLEVLRSFPWKLMRKGTPPAQAEEAGISNASKRASDFFKSSAGRGGKLIGCIS
jgi:hypothetical protein